MRLGCGELTSRDRFRVVHGTRGDQWVEIHGETGIDPDILLRRALVSALELDVKTNPGNPELVAALEQAVHAILAAQCGRQARGS